jgi:CubicO group peptidase (beta-lactamase class C family)
LRANWEPGVPTTPRTRFRIASITKTFTGAAVVMLAERGKLSLQDPLSRFIPEFPSGEKIRIRHLLLHQSGVGNPESEPCDDVALDGLVAQIARKPLSFPPGTSSLYSNGGYALLARVIEKASGRPWEDFLREEIFRPLSLTETCRDRMDKIVPNRAEGYVPGPGPLRLVNAPCTSAEGAIGSGALLSTAGDLRVRARAVRNQRLFRRTALEHPYGWGIRTYFGRAAIEQSGIVNGAASYVAAYLNDDVYVVVLSNVQTGLVDQVGKGLGAIALGAAPPVLTASPDARPATDEERLRWVGRYANASIGAFTVDERMGELYQRWEGARFRSYIALLNDRSAHNAQESAAMQPIRDQEGGIKAIQVSWGGSTPQEFQRSQ